MSQPPENPAQEAQELATTPTIEPRQESTLLQQAQESLQIMETPSQNKEDENDTQLQQSLEDAIEFLSSGNDFLAPRPSPEEDEDNDEEGEEDDDASPEPTPILPRDPTPGMTYTRPHKIGGMTFPEKAYDIPLPCTTPTEAERRRISLGVSRLPDKVQQAMRTLKHKVDIPTVYPTMDDLWSVEDWNTHGPQCWRAAPDLCVWFAQLGNRYQQPSSFQVMMLSTMPFLRLPEFTTVFHQFEGEGHFNWMRNDNIDSLLAYMCGKVVKKRSRCQRCKNHSGMMEQCVVIEGHMRNACTNCWKNSKQASCEHYEEPSKKSPKKRSHDDLATDVTLESSSSAPKKRATKDWGTAQNVVNPSFTPRFEPLRPPPQNAAATRKATLKLKSHKGKEKAPTPPREPTPPVRSLDELRQAGLIEDEEKLQSLMDAYNVKPVEEIRAEKDNFKAIFRHAAVERQQCVADVQEAEHTLRNARDTLQAAESQMVNAEKCVALLNQVKGATQAKLTLGGF